ncbi:MAG: cation:dicarboxylase symporter family transporter [Spirochaetota bacterium]|nr:cation:dicarboxylase symporter family transporter [Spirochaetota bacterium]
MKIWIKMLFAMIFAVVLTIFLPADNASFKAVLSLLSKISLNILLYFAVIHTFVRFYVGFVNIKREKRRLRKATVVFVLCIFASLIFTAAISVFAMNVFSSPQESFFNFNQHSSYKMQLFTFSDLLQKIFPDNAAVILTKSTSFLLPLLVLALVLAAGTLKSGKKGDSFYDILKSLGDILDSIEFYVLEFAPVFSFFIIAAFARYGFSEVSNIAMILRPIRTIVVVCVVTIAVISVFFHVFFKINPTYYYRNILGAALVGAATGNVISTIIPLNLHLKRNVKLNHDIVDVLVPIGSVLNQTGTVIVSTVVLLSIIVGYSLNILTLELQFAIFLLVILFSFRLDGSTEFTFLVLIAMIFKVPGLHLEESSYLLFIGLAPLFSRIAVFINVFTTGIYTLMAARYISGIQPVENQESI